MDHDLMWSNDFEGEAFLEISKLPGIPSDSSNDTRPLDELKQIELCLTHPKGSNENKSALNKFFSSFSCKKSHYRSIRTTCFR